MRRLYRWLCRKAWADGFDAGIAHERIEALRFHHQYNARPQWFFVSQAGIKRMELQ